MTRLKYSAGEVERVAAVLGVAPTQDLIKLREQATERQVKESDLSRYRILHFAAHARAGEALSLTCAGTAGAPTVTGAHRADGRGPGGASGGHRGRKQDRGAPQGDPRRHDDPSATFLNPNEPPQAQQGSPSAALSTVTVRTPVRPRHIRRGLGADAPRVEAAATGCHRTRYRLTASRLECRPTGRGARSRHLRQRISRQSMFTARARPSIPPSSATARRHRRQVQSRACGSNGERDGSYWSCSPVIGSRSSRRAPKL